MKTMLTILAVTGVLALPFAAQACGLSEKTAEGYENATIEHAAKHWQQGEASPVPFVIIDVRTPEEYAEGHVDGARLIPVDELEERLAEVPTDKQVYVYCRSGKRSARAAALLASHGFGRVENVLGGILAWQEAGHPVVKQGAGQQ